MNYTGTKDVMKELAAVSPLHRDLTYEEVEKGNSLWPYHGEPLRGEMNEVPEIEVRALSNNLPPTGVGELGLDTTGAAVANAVFAATGARIRELPMTPARVLATLRG